MAKVRTNVVAALAVGVAVSLLAVGCGSKKATTDQSASAGSGGSATADGREPDGETPHDGGTLIVGIGAETNGWNPALNQWADTGSLVGSSVIEPLATQGSDGGAKPWLATSWIANSSFDQWTINLRPNVTFQNGEPFDATAVKLNLDAYINGPLSGLALKPMFRSVEAIDPLTVQVTLTQTWAAFPSSFLDGGSSLMMAPAMIAAEGGGARHPIGTGPFTFDKWEPGNFFRAKKNPTYWQPGLPHLDQIEFRVLPDEGVRAAALRTGDVNMILTTNAEDANTLGQDDTVVKDWASENAFVMTNTSAAVGGKANPLHDIHARRALAYATDRAAVAAAIGEGLQLSSSPWSPASPWGLPDDQNGYVDHDLDKARAEVALYLADTGATSLSFTLSGLPNVDDAKVLQLLQDQWREAGITVAVEQLEQSAYITKIALGNYQAAFFRNYGYPDPDSDLYFWSSTTVKDVGSIGINFSHFTSPEIERDLVAGRQSGFPEQRKDAYHDLARQLNASMTNIWLYRTPYSFIAAKSVRGLNGARDVRFGNFQPKTWLGGLWRADD